MKKFLPLFLFAISLQSYAQITCVNVNPDCSSTIVTNQSATGLCSISLPGSNNIIFRWDSFSPMEWFYHVEAATNNVSIAISTTAGTNPYGKPYANVFSSGNAINNSSTYNNSDPLISDNSKANFSGQGDRYIGFRFTNLGQTYYGWILINSTGQGLTVKEYAYETTANTSINAGDKGTLSTQDFNTKNLITVYPNPVNSIINIETDNEIHNAKIYSISGSLLIDENNLLYNKLDVSNLQNGYYFLKINDTKTISFIKE